MDEHPSRFILERLQARDLDDAEQQRITTHLESCRDCATAWEKLCQSDAEFRAAIPYAEFRIEHERRKAQARPERARRWTWLPGLTAAALASLATLVLVRPLLRDHELRGMATERTKGAEVGLSFAVLEQGKLRAGVVGETLAAGSIVQLSYDAGRYTHVAVLGSDGKGELSVYFSDGEALALLPAGKSGRLPFSLTLDAAPGIERFIAVFAKSPLPLDRARRLAGDLAAGHPIGQEIGVDATDVGYATVWVRKP